MLVGRDSALAILDDMKAALATGVGGAVLVEGEQGIGKTELLRVSLAGGSAYRLLWGAADELGRSVPLTLMRQCLAGVDVGPSGQVLDAGGRAGVFVGDPVLVAAREYERTCEGCGHAWGVPKWAAHPRRHGLTFVSEAGGPDECGSHPVLCGSESLSPGPVPVTGVGCRS